MYHHTMPRQLNALRRLLSALFARVRRSVVARVDDRRVAQQESTLGDVVSVLVDDPPPGVGLDVYDTLLVRRLVGDAAAEHAIASAMEGEAVVEGSRRDYQAGRRRARTERPDGPMSAWHDGMAVVEDPAAADGVERSIEDSMTVGVPGAADELDRLREVSDVSYVSDMHLDAGFIQGLLDRHVGGGESDRLYVSSDHGVSKSDGGLFEQLDDADAPVTAFVGNNAWADVTQPRLAGLRPYPATVGNPSAYESIMAADPTSAGPAIAGAARLQRLTARSDGHRGPTPRVVGGQVLGQTMSAFLLWTRTQCEEHDLHRLEFLARDGELPLRMARAMPADHWTGIELAYLHASRRSWSLAAAAVLGVPSWIEIGTKTAAGFLTNSAGVVAFENLLDRCGLTLADVPERSPLAGHDPNQPLDPTEVDHWIYLLQSGDLDGDIARAAAEPFELLGEFLSQRGLPDQRFGIVDVGWTGQQALLISALIGATTGHEPVHLHFGGDHVDPELDARVDIRRFALDDSVRPHPIRGPVSCLEMLLATGHARITGYERQSDGTIAEVFEEASTTVDNATRREVHEGAVQVAALLPRKAEMERWGQHHGSLGEETRRLLAQFWNRPDRDLVEALRPLMFEVDDGGALFAPVAQPYHLRELLGRDAIPRTWRQGSLAITPQPLRLMGRTFFAATDHLRR